MTGGARGWCNPYGAVILRYRVAPGPYAGPVRLGYPRPAGAYRVYSIGRPRWGLRRGGLGRGWGGRRSRGRRW